MKAKEKIMKFGNHFLKKESIVADETVMPYTETVYTIIAQYSTTSNF